MNNRQEVVDGLTQSVMCRQAFKKFSVLALDAFPAEKINLQAICSYE